MSLIKVFSLGFNSSNFDLVANEPHIVKVNLDKLQLIDGLKNDNQQLSEDRIFLSKEVDKHIYTSDAPEFIGFATWRWHDKFAMKKPITEWKRGGWRADSVYVVAKIDNWYEESCFHHPGMRKYLVEMAKIGNMKLGLKNGLYFNNFVCTAQVYSEFQIFFREIFWHFHKKYEYDFDFFVIPKHEVRKAACLYERVAALYFSNRTDLKMIELV